MESVDGPAPVADESNEGAEDVEDQLQALYAEAAACEAMLAAMEARTSLAPDCLVCKEDDKDQEVWVADLELPTDDVADAEGSETGSENECVPESSSEDECDPEENQACAEATGVVNAAWLDDDDQMLSQSDKAGDVTALQSSRIDGHATGANSGSPLNFDVSASDLSNKIMKALQSVSAPISISESGARARALARVASKPVVPVEEIEQIPDEMPGQAPAEDTASTASSDDESSSSEEPMVPMQTAESTGPVIFSLLLDRSAGARLGIDIETGRASTGWDGRTLLIRSIQSSGLVEAWNAEYPVKAVFPGDRISAVNGVSGDAKVLIAECSKLQVLELTLTRDLGSSQPASESPVPQAPQRVPPQTGPARQPPRPAVADKKTVDALKAEVGEAKSATVVVHILRRELQKNWAASWGADALLQISLRSTEQTREAWAKDPIVLELADSLMREAFMSETISPTGSDIEVLLIALEGLRRMNLQTIEQQRAPLMQVVEQLCVQQWSRSTKLLARLLWLASPLQLGKMEPVNHLLRKQYLNLDASDFYFIVAALRCRRRHILVDQSCRLKSSTKLTDLSVIRNFRISFNLVPHGIIDDPSSVLRLADEGQDPLMSRGCLPTICMCEKSTRLHVFLGPQTRPTVRFEQPPPGLPMGEPSRITLILANDILTIYINGQEVAANSVRYHDDATGHPTSVKTHVWAGDTVYEAAAASIGNLVFLSNCNHWHDDDKLLYKVSLRLQEEKFCASLSTADLVLMTEALDDLGMRNKKALQVLGQEILQRKPEFSPDEFRLLEIAYNQCKLPLNTVWATLGASKKRKGGDTVTAQVFAPQQGHEKKQRSERDVERTSPPRYVSDPVQSSY